MIFVIFFRSSLPFKTFYYPSFVNSISLNNLSTKNAISAKFLGFVIYIKRSFICCYRICMTVPLTFRETGILSSFFTDHYYDRNKFYWGCFCGLF